MDAVRRPYIAAVSGVKNSGKTTFLEKLVAELTSRGYQVAVIKHDGHEFQADREGTDTYRIQKAGAYGTCVFSSGQWQIVKQQENMDVEQLADFFPEADIILIEGMKNSSYPKFELIRKEISKENVCDPKTLLGIVTDLEIQIAEVPVFRLDEIRECADVLQKIVENNRIKEKK